MSPKTDRYNELRSQYPFFIYEHYKYTIGDDALMIRFLFNISDKFYFTTKLSIKKRSFICFEKLSISQMDILIFHIGLIELISYWKLTCSPKVHVKPHHLTSEQIEWWKNVYYHGLGEFFFRNHIENVTVDNFMDISTMAKNTLKPESYNLADTVIIPIGGGKDSIVTLELLRDYCERRIPFILNPRKTTVETILVGGFCIDDIVEVDRQLDPQLMTLNSDGFLNGHTPFSAVLAFLGLLISAATNSKHLALSNESSANEATVQNTSINHQYSKSISFERDFRYYVSRFISEDFNYFSFLRPLSELTISKLFVRFDQYFYIFKSCNIGSKNDKWCCQCSKCLFTFIILSPYIHPDLLERIFGENLLDKATLEEEFKQLLGLENNKPFECVGTYAEVNKAIDLSLHYYPVKYPYLIENLVTIFSKQVTLPDSSQNIWNTEHFLTEPFEKILKCKIY